MSRKLKVFSYNYQGLYRVVCAAYSRDELQRNLIAAGYKALSKRDMWDMVAVSGNIAEMALANSKPGAVFWRPRHNTSAEYKEGHP